MRAALHGGVASHLVTPFTFAERLRQQGLRYGTSGRPEHRFRWGSA